MDALAAGKLSRRMDLVHSASYFVPEAAEMFGALGMTGRMPYFAVRSAAMGAVTADVVAATFYNFSPALIATCIPAAWEIAPPAQVVALRYQLVETAIPRVLGDDLVSSPAFVRAAELLQGAAEAIPNGDGRPLYAGHAGVDWPASVCGRLWHAQTLLREYRGDGHIAALVAHGLSGLEALVSHTIAGIGFSVEFAQRLRGWSSDDWAGAEQRLRQRGLVDDAGSLTASGVELRGRIEDLTDELAFAPWSVLSDDDAAEVDAVAAEVRSRVASAGLFPPNAFGPRYGEHR